MLLFCPLPNWHVFFVVSILLPLARHTQPTPRNATFIYAHINSILFHNQHGRGNQSRFLERLGHVDIALEGLSRERSREAGDGIASLALDLLCQLKQGCLSGERLGDVSPAGLQPKTGLVVVGLWLGRSGTAGRSGDGLGLGGSSFAGSLGLLGLAATFGLVGFDLGLDALLGLLVVELLLSLLLGFLDLLLAGELLLGLLGLPGRLLTDFLG